MIRIRRGFFAKKWSVILTKFKRWNWPTTLPTIDKQRGFPQIMRQMRKWLILLFFCPGVMRGQTQPATEALDQLANDFWSWRAKYAPFTADDVNRLKPPGSVRDWSAAAIDKRTRDLKELDARYQKIDSRGWPIPQQVDYRLIGSALSRVRWELEVNARWKRDPNFYIEQTLTPIVEALTIPAPYDEGRSREILSRIENIPAILRSALGNLQSPPAPFARVAIQTLENIRPRLEQMAKSVQPSTTLSSAELGGATERAVSAVEQFRRALLEQLPSLPQTTALGRDAYLFFLKKIA